MKQKYGKLWKSVLSLMLVICMIWGVTGPYVSQGEVKAEETQTEETMPDFSKYDVMTLADNALTDNDYKLENQKTMAGTVAANRTNFLGALYDFHLTVDNNMMLILGANSAGWTGIQFQFQNGKVVLGRGASASNAPAGNSPHTFDTTKSRLEDEMRIWITMDYIASGEDGVTNGVQVTLWIDKEYIGTHTFWNLSNITGELGTQILFFANSGAVNFKLRSATPEEMTEYYKDYKELSMSDFGISSTTYEIGTGKKVYSLANTNSSLVSLDGAVLSTYLQMQGSAEIRYGVAGGDQGVRIYTWQNNFNIKYVAATGEVTLKSFASTSTEAKMIQQGCDFKLFTTSIDSDRDGSKDDLKIGLYLKNDTRSFYGSYRVIDGMANFGGTYCTIYYVKADSVATSKMVISEPNVTLDETAYTRKTPSDLGFDFATAIENSQSSVQSTKGIADYNKIMFDVNLTFKSGSQIFYGLPGAWYGIWIKTNDAEDGLTVTLNPTDDYKAKASNITSSITCPIGESVNLKITTDYVDYDLDGKLDVKLGIWINDKLSNNHYIYLTDYTDCMKPLVLLVGFDWNIVSSDEWKTLSDVYYNLADSEKGYLVTTSGTAYVNGVVHDLSEALNTPGVYNIKRKQVFSETQNLQIYQKVTLYTIGDLNLDGSVTADDTAILQDMLLGKLTSEVGKRAGDVNNDGEITHDDLQILEKVVANETTIEDVIEKYDVPSTTYNYLGSDEVMPITGFWGPWSSNFYTDKNGNQMLCDYLNDDIYQLIVNSGINMLVLTRDLYENSPTEVLKELEMAEKYNLGMLVRDSDLSELDATDIEALAKRLGEYSQYNSFLGIHLQDEPWTDAYKPTASAPDSQNLSLYTGVAKNLNSYSNLQGYLNLLGYSTDLPIDTYRNYLETATQDAGMKNIATSQYLFMNENSTVDDAKKYFTTLSEVRAKSIDKNIPFSTYAQLGGDFYETEHDTVKDAIPTEAETYWQIHMPLAFGAKAIEYFTVLQPVTMSRATTETEEVKTCGDNAHFCNAEGRSCGYLHDFDRVGLIGADGEPTTYYAYAKKANEQIAAVDEVLMKATSKGVIAVGQKAQTNTNELEGVSNDTSVTTKLDSVAAESGNTYGAIVGCFDYQDTEAYYVVNYDVTKAQKITLTLKSEGSYSVVLDAVESIGKGKVIEIEIPAGEAALVVLDEDQGATYVKFDDISAYRSEDVEKTPHIAPTLSGYVFAGWFTENGGNTAIAETTTSGSAWAKFVDEDLLQVKAQVRYGTVENMENIGDDKMNIRFVTTVDGPKYKNIGFILEYNGKVVNETSEYYHSTLKAWTDNNIQYKTYSPQEFCTEAKYFKALTLTGVSKEYFNTPIKATAYWTTKDGTVVRGESSIKRVYQGIETVTSPEKLGFAKRLTLSDFGIRGGIYTDATGSKNGVYQQGLAAMDGAYLDVDIAMPNGESTGSRLCFASLNNAWGGIWLYVKDNVLYLYNDSSIKIPLSDYGVTTGEIFNLKLGMKGVDTTASPKACTIGIWINGMYAGGQTYSNTNKDINFGSQLHFVPNAQKMIIREPIE